MEKLLKDMLYPNIMLKSFRIINLLLFSFLIALSSCTLLGFGKEQYSECCNFDTEDLELSVTCEQEKIRAVQILVSNPKDVTKFSPVYFEKTFSSPTNVAVIPSPPDSIIQGYNLTIKIWTNTHVIDDYRITVTNKDWQSKKLIYGVYNYR